MSRFQKILNERPAGMSFERYKELRAEQNKRIKRHLKGRLVYVAVQLFYNDRGELIGRSKPEHNKPFRGDTSKLKP